MYGATGKQTLMQHLFKRSGSSSPDTIHISISSDTISDVVTAGRHSGCAAAGTMTNKLASTDTISRQQDQQQAAQINKSTYSRQQVHWGNRQHANSAPSSNRLSVRWGNRQGLARPHLVISHSSMEAPASHYSALEPHQHKRQKQDGQLDSTVLVVAESRGAGTAVHDEDEDVAALGLMMLHGSKASQKPADSMTANTPVRTTAQQARAAEAEQLLGKTDAGQQSLQPRACHKRKLHSCTDFLPATRVGHNDRIEDTVQSRTACADEGITAWQKVATTPASCFQGPLPHGTSWQFTGASMQRVVGPGSGDGSVKQHTHVSAEIAGETCRGAGGSAAASPDAVQNSMIDAQLAHSAAAQAAIAAALAAADTPVAAAKLLQRVGQVLQQHNATKTQKMAEAGQADKAPLANISPSLLLAAAAAPWYPYGGTRGGLMLQRNGKLVARKLYTLPTGEAVRQHDDVAEAAAAAAEEALAAAGVAAALVVRAHLPPQQQQQLIGMKRDTAELHTAVAPSMHPTWNEQPQQRLQPSSQPGQHVKRPRCAAPDNSGGTKGWADMDCMQQISQDICQDFAIAGHAMAAVEDAITSVESADADVATAAANVNAACAAAADIAKPVHVMQSGLEQLKGANPLFTAAEVERTACGPATGDDAGIMQLSDEEMLRRLRERQQRRQQQQQCNGAGQHQQHADQETAAAAAGSNRPSRARKAPAKLEDTWPIEAVLVGFTSGKTQVSKAHQPQHQQHLQPSQCNLPQQHMQQQHIKEVRALPAGMQVAGGMSAVDRKLASIKLAHIAAAAAAARARERFQGRCKSDEASAPSAGPDLQTEPTKQAVVSSSTTVSVVEYEAPVVEQADSQAEHPPTAVSDPAADSEGAAGSEAALPASEGDVQAGDSPADAEVGELERRVSQTADSSPGICKDKGASSNAAAAAATPCIDVSAAPALDSNSAAGSPSVAEATVANQQVARATEDPAADPTYHHNKLRPGRTKLAKKSKTHEPMLKKWNQVEHILLEQQRQKVQEMLQRHKQKQMAAMAARAENKRDTAVSAQSSQQKQQQRQVNQDLSGAAASVPDQKKQQGQQQQSPEQQQPKPTSSTAAVEQAHKHKQMEQQQTQAQRRTQKAERPWMSLGPLTAGKQHSLSPAAAPPVAAAAAAAAAGTADSSIKAATGALASSAVQPAPQAAHAKQILHPLKVAGVLSPVTAPRAAAAAGRAGLPAVAVSPAAPAAKAPLSAVILQAAVQGAKNAAAQSGSPAAALPSSKLPAGTNTVVTPGAAAVVHRPPAPTTLQLHNVMQSRIQNQQHTSTALLPQPQLASQQSAGQQKQEKAKAAPEVKTASSLRAKLLAALGGDDRDNDVQVVATSKSSPASGTAAVVRSAPLVRPGQPAVLQQAGVASIAVSNAARTPVQAPAAVVTTAAQVLRPVPTSTPTMARSVAAQPAQLLPGGMQQRPSPVTPGVTASAGLPTAAVMLQRIPGQGLVGVPVYVPSARSQDQQRVQQMLARIQEQQREQQQHQQRQRLLQITAAQRAAAAVAAATAAAGAARCSNTSIQPATK